MDNKRLIAGSVNVDGLETGLMFIFFMLVLSVLSFGYGSTVGSKIDEKVSGDVECTAVSVGTQVVTRDRTLLECVELKGTSGSRHAFVRMNRVEVP